MNIAAKLREAVKLKDGDRLHLPSPECDREESGEMSEETTVRRSPPKRTPMGPLTARYPHVSRLSSKEGYLLPSSAIDGAIIVRKSRLRRKADCGRRKAGKR